MRQIGDQQNGRIEINRIYELAENIYRGFSLDEVDNQFLMAPYGGFRFEGIMEVTETCIIKSYDKFVFVCRCVFGGNAISSVCRRFCSFAFAKMGCY